MGKGENGHFTNIAIFFYNTKLSISSINSSKYGYAYKNGSLSIFDFCRFVILSCLLSWQKHGFLSCHNKQRPSMSAVAAKETKTTKTREKLIRKIEFYSVNFDQWLL